MKAVEEEEKVVEEGGGGRGREGLEGLIEPVQRRRGPNSTQEIHATLIDHVINHGLTLMEAGQRDQPNLRNKSHTLLEEKVLYRTLKGSISAIYLEPLKGSTHS